MKGIRYNLISLGYYEFAFANQKYSSLMESSNNYRRRGRRTDVIGHISKHTRLLWKWHQDFRRTAKYVGIDSMSKNNFLGRWKTRDSSVEARLLRCILCNDVASPIAQQEWKTRIAAVRQKTFISYKTVLPFDSRWEPRRKLFWNPRASTSPGMIRFSHGKISPWTGFLYALTRPKRIISFSRYCCERETIPPIVYVRKVRKVAKLINNKQRYFSSWYIKHKIVTIGQKYEQIDFTSKLI